MERQFEYGLFDDFPKLLHEARSGSKDAKDDLYLPYPAIFRHWCYQTFGNKSSPERGSDIVQGIFLVAWQSFEQFQGETEEEFTSWLRTIFRNELNQIFRFQHRERRDVSHTVPLEAIPESNLTRDEQTPLDRLATTEEMRNLRRALKTLPEEERTLIRYRFARKWSYDHIAGQLGCSPEAARKRCQRALADLLQELPAG